MALGVDDFKAKLKGGGARSNLFKVTLLAPQVAGLDTELASFMVEGANLPASRIDPIPVAFRGRYVQVAGDRTFDPWTVTVINDTGFEIRDALERWMNSINAHKTNTGERTPTSYESDLYVDQLDREGGVLKRYYFRGCFPSELSEIALSFGTNNEIERFTATFQVQYWEGLSGNGQKTTS